MNVELAAAIGNVTQSERWDIEDVASRTMSWSAASLVEAYALLRDTFKAHDPEADELRGALEDAELARDELRASERKLESEVDDLERELATVRQQLDAARETLK